MSRRPLRACIAWSDHCWPSNGAVQLPCRRASECEWAARRESFGAPYIAPASTCVVGECKSSSRPAVQSPPRPPRPPHAAPPMSAARAQPACLPACICLGPLADSDSDSDSDSGSDSQTPHARPHDRLRPCPRGSATDAGWPPHRPRAAMTSPHPHYELPHHDEQHLLAPAPPNNVTLSYAAAAHAHAVADAHAHAHAGTVAGAGAGTGTDSGLGTSPAVSFSVLAAAATLATLSDSRPPTSHGEDAISDDDDGGGISLADFTAPPPAPPALLATSLGAAGIHMHAAMAHYQSFAHDTIPPPTSDMTSFHINNVHLPPPPPYLAHLSSSEPSLEPLPTWPDAYLSIKDKSQFVPITSFFHYLTPEKSTVPGLDLVQLPNVITRDDLRGDKYDYQGIDWSVRNTTRRAVRSKRRECEQERLSPSLRETRTVGRADVVKRPC